MRKRRFDIIVIVVIALFLTILLESGVLEKSAMYMFIPILAFYYLGQFSERKFQK